MNLEHFFDIIINSMINNFDFAYMLLINITVYLILKYIDKLNKEKPITTWHKQIVTAVAVIAWFTIYKLYGDSSTITLINSSLLALVSWDYLFKPILKFLNLDYKSTK